MADIKNSHIQGDLTISSNLNEIGSLNTNFIEEATSSSGVSILSSNLKIGKKIHFKNNGNLTTDLQLDNDNLFKVINNTGSISILTSGNKGILISDTSGNVLINSTTDSIDENTGSLITTGGAVIGKTLNVKENIRALDGLNFFKNTSSSQNVIDIVNTNINGTSSIIFKNSSEANKLEIGYGNSGLSSPFNDTSFIQSVAGSELLLRANSQDSIKLSTNASVDFYSTLASTSSTIGSVRLQGGLSISNSTDATSSTSGGSFTTAGGMSIAKKLFIGSSANIESFIDIKYITTPSNPVSEYSRLYIDNNDQNLKSHNSSGIVKIYNPNSTKGDLITHDGTTDVRLPGGTLNQILYSDSSLSSGIGWKDLSTETSSSNPLSSKYLEVYNSANQTITGSYTDIIFESVRTTSNDAFTRLSSSIIKFLESGTYIIMSRVSLDIISGTTDTRSSIKFVLDNNNDIYADVAGSTSSLYNRSASFRTGSTSNFAILDITANRKLKVQVIRNTGTSTLNTVINGCNLIIIKSGVDFSDSSKHFNAYTNSNTNLSGSFIDIPLNVIRQTDSPFTFTSGTSTVTITESGKYFINYGVGCDKTSGTDLSSSENRLMLSDNSGMNFTQVNGSLLYTYHVTNNYTTSNSKFTCLNLTSGQILKIQSRIYTGTNLRTSSGPTFIGIVKFQSTSSGQTTPKFLNITNSTSLDILNSYTDLTFNTNDLLDSIYTHTTSSEEIIVSEEGKYIVMCGYSANMTTSVDSVSQIRLLIDSGTGYSEIAGSISGCYHSSTVAGVNSCISFITINMSSSSKLKAQAIRSYGNSNISTIENGINISILKIDSPEIAINSLIKFGTFYRYIESLGQTSTTSITYIDKLTLTTDTLLEGYYRIGIFYTVSTNTNNGEMEVRVLEDNINTIFENSYSIASNNIFSSTPFYSPKELFLTSGIHIFKIQFKSVVGISNIRDTKIEFWRVK